MSYVTKTFAVTEHIVPAQHIREYPNGVKDESQVLRLAVKEYRPLTQTLAPNAYTIIATHANGIVKESYEPLWDDLFRLYPGQIRAIWFADCVHQGASGILNEALLGDDCT